MLCINLDPVVVYKLLVAALILRVHCGDRLLVVGPCAYCAPHNGEACLLAAPLQQVPFCFYTLN
jgi:hypothetical protein